MKHSYGLTIGLYIREPDYTRGQSIVQWLMSVNWGRSMPWSPDELKRPGGHEERTSWARITIAGVSLQVNIEHAISNWSRRPTNK
jgi:hypothetical protein